MIQTPQAQLPQTQLLNEVAHSGPDFGLSGGTSCALDIAEKRTERTVSPCFKAECVESHDRVISVTALEQGRADHSQGESGVSSGQPRGAKSLPLNILPLSC